MNILILGGTGFLGPHLVELALGKGWTITTFNRGKTAPDLFSGERHRGIVQLRGDRDPAKGDGLRSLEAHVARMRAEGRRFDAVIDNSSYVPRITKASAELLAPVTMMYQLVSTVSVWMDNSVVPDEETPVSTMADPSIEKVTGETYGPLKALCEQAAERACPGKACIVRPGLIVGPGDDSLRFTYWPVRLAEGGTVLAPRAPRPQEQFVQFIDVRDLAAFMLRLVADGHEGTFVATGPREPLTMEAMLRETAAAVGSSAKLEWADEAWLLGRQVAPWMGLPLWIPQSPETAGAGRARIAKALAHGLAFRPLPETAKDTLDDFRRTAAERPADFAWGTGRAPGIARERERELVAAWAART
jgi:2'-hydroxyisoflavone reductase